MNQDQVMSIARAVLQIVGTFLISNGIFTEANWGTAAGAILVLVGIGWGMYAQTKANKVAAVAAMPEVAKVVLTPTPEGLALKNAAGSTPSAQVTIA